MNCLALLRAFDYLATAAPNMASPTAISICEERPFDISNTRLQGPHPDSNIYSAALCCFDEDIVGS